MLREAFNSLAYFHSRAATLKRLGSPDVTTPIRITPSNYFRNQEGPSQTIVEGREFIVPLDTIETKFNPIVKRGDRIVDPVLGTLIIDEITEVYDLGASLMGYRLRTG